MGIALTLLAYVLSPGVRRAVSHAEHRVSHSLDRVFDRDAHAHAHAKHRLTRSSGAPSGSRSGTSSASAACTNGARSVCLTPSAGGRTVAVGVGWTVAVRLGSPNSIWSEPSLHGRTLLRQLGAARRKENLVEVAYTAIAPGETDLRATERPACSPAHMCPQFILLWEVHIRVSPR
jgi:hypothetical protein